jgi:hypothetical protein
MRRWYPPAPKEARGYLRAAIENACSNIALAQVTVGLAKRLSRS